MKKRYIGLIVAGSLIASGGILIAASGSLVHWDYKTISTCPIYVNRTVNEVSSGLSLISVNAINDKINVTQSSEVSQVVVEVMENEYETYQTKVENGVLSVDYTWGVPWYKNIFYIPLNEKVMNITVPQDYEGGLSLKLINGTINVDDINLGNYCSIENMNGSVVVDNLSTSRYVKASSVNGKVEITNSTATSYINASTTNGSVILKDIACEDLTASTLNGEINLESITSSDDISLNDTNGQINFTSISFGKKCSLTTLNGAIRGSIVGKQTDFLIDSSSANGSNNLKAYSGILPTTGSKELVAKSTNGSIYITFK